MTKAILKRYQQITIIDNKLVETVFDLKDKNVRGVKDICNKVAELINA